MGLCQNCVFCSRNHRKLVISLVVFLVSSIAHDAFFAQGRQMSNAIEAVKGKEGERILIGSRPPRCEGRCKNCGHCEAIQVPIVPGQHNLTPRIAYSRGDDFSNYKPMSWKCKCGDSIFNP